MGAMKLARGRTAALVVAACVMFGVGACGGGTGNSSVGASGTPGAVATSSKAPDPKEALLSALAGYDKGVFAVEFAGRDSSGSAAVDVPKKQVYMKVVSTVQSSTLTLEVLAIEPDTYVKVNAAGELTKMPGMQQMNGKLWMHIDPSKVKDPDDAGIDFDDLDTFGLTALLKSAQSVQQAGNQKYSGTLDLAKGESMPMTDEAVAKALGAKAATVPFTATLDAEGRLAELLIDVPAAGATKPHQLKMTLTQYGTATVPAKPTGKAVIEAPAKVYDFLNA
jgi:hypothetical protein